MKSIEANIAGTKIPLKVSEEEEAYVKKAIDEVNKRIKHYQSEFTRMEVHDCVKMVLLSYAVENHKNQARTVDDTSWDKLLDIQKQLHVLEAQAID